MSDTPRILARREFIRLAAPALPIALAACGWDGGKRLQPLFDKVIGFNNRLGEGLMSVTHGRAFEQQIARGEMPAYFISKPGMPVLADSAAWHLDVGGLVRKPTQFTLPMLAALPHLGYTITHHCVEGWSVVKSWHGIPFTTIAALVEPLPSAQYVQFDSFDDGYMNGWDIESAMHPQTILADAFEGEADHRRAWRAAPALFPDQARLQAHQVSHEGDLHRQEAGRLLGGSGLSVVRGAVAPQPRATAARPGVLFWTLVLPHGNKLPDLARISLRSSGMTIASPETSRTPADPSCSVFPR